MRDAFFEHLAEAAEVDHRIFILSADHGALKLDQFQADFPDRYINIGISEQNMVGVATGLAASGKTVFIYGITPFVSLRILEQLTLDVAATQLPINVISVGAGFTYSTDGLTHLGLQDIAAIASIPGMQILNSSDPVNTRAFIDIAVSGKKPNYIRIEKEKLGSFVRLNSDFINDGYSVLTDSSADCCVISTGSISHSCLEATKNFINQTRTSVCMIDVHTLKSENSDRLSEFLGKFKHLVTFEEGYITGLGGLISRIHSRNNLKSKLDSVGVPEEFIFEGDSREQMLKRFELDRHSIEMTLRKLITNKE